MKLSDNKGSNIALRLWTRLDDFFFVFWTLKIPRNQKKKKGLVKSIIFLLLLKRCYYYVVCGFYYCFLLYYLFHIFPYFLQTSLISLPSIESCNFNLTYFPISEWDEILYSYVNRTTMQYYNHIEWIWYWIWNKTTSFFD